MRQRDEQKIRDINTKLEIMRSAKEREERLAGVCLNVNFRIRLELGLVLELTLGLELEFAVELTLELG